MEAGRRQECWSPPGWSLSDITAQPNTWLAKAVPFHMFLSTLSTCTHAQTQVPAHHTNCLPSEGLQGSLTAQQRSCEVLCTMEETALGAAGKPGPQEEGEESQKTLIPQVAP